LASSSALRRGPKLALYYLGQGLGEGEVLSQPLYSSLE